jgi:hypothetical protein
MDQHHETAAIQKYSEWFFYSPFVRPSEEIHHQQLNNEIAKPEKSGDAKPKGLSRKVRQPVAVDNTSVINILKCISFCLSIATVHLRPQDSRFFVSRKYFEANDSGGKQNDYEV